MVNGVFFSGFLSYAIRGTKKERLNFRQKTQIEKKIFKKLISGFTT
jgi:hypothetical protein